nr:MAG TPA: hypothetical protein [Caudoviricetes sp.]
MFSFSLPPFLLSVFCFPVSYVYNISHNYVIVNDKITFF